MDSTIPLLSKIRNLEPLAILCEYKALFVSDLVGNPEDRFSQNEAHLLPFSSGDYLLIGGESALT